MRTIVFEDNGQDFLEWDIDLEGIVTACRPFQEWVWKGVRVIKAEVGQLPTIQMKGTKGKMFLRHKVMEVR